MDREEVLEILNEVGALVTGGHFVYTKGGHGSAYINKDVVSALPAKLFKLCMVIAGMFSDDGIETVVSPATGGVPLSQQTTFALSMLTGRMVHAVYAEKETVAISDPEGCGRTCFAEMGAFVLKRGFNKYVSKKRVLVVEDILNTGGSARNVVECVRRTGGNVVGIGALVNRGGVTKEMLDVPELYSALDITLDMMTEEECARRGPCAAGVPINTEVGKGMEFLARKRRA